ncbi:mRNA export factor mex67 [Patellaria atrata CBS 101060]|uniref:mRNA export factor MEX67 n=1 Tax=Patellaria atrata CBS 101060 TaxID=1346257 RepID=A0A9P4VKA8_9PEZI|nr:mRNA export factor mex67 [Patellaria atrata CBS 101060]
MSSRTETKNRGGRDPHQQPQRSGVNKNRTNLRVDRDGDLVMGAPKAKRGGISKNKNRGGARDQPERMRIDKPGMAAAIAKHIAQNNTQGSRSSTPVSFSTQRKDIKVTGWKKSKASSNADGGISSLIAFLEKRMGIQMSKRVTAGSSTAQHVVKITDYRVDGDAVVINLPAADASALLRLNGYQFAAANIKVEQLRDRSGSPQNKSTSQTTEELKTILTNLLTRRYNAEQKLLDLSALGQDTELNALGMFDSPTTQAKLFPALMKVCDEQFKTAQEKQETILGVSIANNELTSVQIVASLAPTLPQLKNLDISNNKFANLSAIQAWKHKFRHLDHIVTTGNPFEQMPEHQTELLKWYPTLRFLNGVQVRSDEEALHGSKGAKHYGKPILGPLFQDENQIAENFIKTFFQAYDQDRAWLVNNYYDATSTFSLAVNTHAKRDPSQQETMQPQEWDQYIKKSRNLKHLNHLQARIKRSFTGQVDILNVLTSLPLTQHPNLLTNGSKWSVECVAQPGVPDPTGQSPTGVGGFLITIHGEFNELDRETKEVQKHRSFDRTFILGPGGATGVRVVSDLLTVRAYGGYEAWVPTEPTVPTMPVAPAAPNAAEQDMIIMEFCKASGMKYEFSKQCLDENFWNVPQAMEQFLAVKDTLPAGAFIQTEEVIG